MAKISLAEAYDDRSVIKKISDLTARIEALESRVETLESSAS